MRNESVFRILRIRANAFQIKEGLCCLFRIFHWVTSTILEVFPIAALVIVNASKASADDWPRYAGVDGLGISNETNLMRSWPETGPKICWSFEVGEGFGGVSISRGRVYLLDRPNDQQDVLRCIQLSDGQGLWNIAYDAPGKLPYNGSRNVPSIDGRYVFTAGPFGHIHCFSLDSQKIVWSRHLVEDFRDPEIDRPQSPTNRLDKLARAQVPMWGLTQAPLVYGDIVILAPQTQRVGLVAFDKLTGKTKWQSGYIGRNWYSHVSPQRMRLSGKDQVIMLAQPSDPEKSPANAPPALVSSIDPATGKILWQTQTPGPYKIPIPQPIQIGDNRLLITGGYQMGCLILQVNFSEGQWRSTVVSHDKSVAAHIHSPVLYRGNIYVSSFKEHGSTHSGLVCLDLNGKPIWQTGPDLKFDDGAMVFADGMAIMMQGKTGHLYLIDVVSSPYKVLASAKVLDPPSVWAPMALSNGRLVVRDQKQLRCIELFN